MMLSVSVMAGMVGARDGRKASGGSLAGRLLIKR